MNLLDRLSQANILDSNQNAYTRKQLEALFKRNNAQTIQRILAPSLRELAVRHLRTSDQPRARQFRKVCDFFVLSDTEAHAQIADAIRLQYGNQYILNKDTGQLTLTLKDQHGILAVHHYALNWVQLNYVCSQMEDEDHTHAIPLDLSNIRQLSDALEDILKTDDEIENPDNTLFLTGSAQRLPIPPEKQLSDTEYHKQKRNLDAWLDYEERSGTWGSDDSAYALAEALVCSLTIIRDIGAKNEALSELEASDPQASTISIRHSGGNHWSSQAHPNTIGDGNCLFNAIAQELHSAYLKEVTQATIQETPTNKWTDFRLKGEQIRGTQKEKDIIAKQKAREDSFQPASGNKAPDASKAFHAALANKTPEEIKQIEEDRLFALGLAEQEEEDDKPSHVP